jgi:cation transporter-like permease
MVKQAEKIRKRNPLLPVFGLIIAVGLFAVAYILSSQVVIKLPQVRGVIGGNQSLATWAFAFVLWLVFLGVAYFFVALAAGKDPDQKRMPLPTRQKDLPEHLRRKKRR